MKEAKRDGRRVDRHVGRRRLSPQDECWPAGWRQLKDAPAAVQVQGDFATLRERSLAIVGTRRASPRGVAVAEGLAAGLARAGWVIVSGMAQGVDTAAHRGALAAGGRTVAVMGTGLAVTFPASNRRLRRRIEGGGCVVSEYADDEGPQKYRFPQRNRLIAGLAEGVIVVEAPRRSGALITAGMAMDLGREVMAVPGPIDQDNYRGSHQLLREGATLVTGPDDVHTVVAPPLMDDGESALGATVAPLEGSPARWIWDRLDVGGIARGELRRRWDGTDAQFAEGMLALEMAALIRRLPGGRLARKIWQP